MTRFWDLCCMGENGEKFKVKGSVLKVVSFYGQSYLLQELGKTLNGMVGKVVVLHFQAG